MAADTPIEAPRIYATFRYRDAPAMIDWLQQAFGFTVRASYPDDAGGIAHAELAFGSAMTMLGSVREDAFAEIVGDPGDSDRAAGVLPGGKAVYIAVDDPDALYRRAKAAGARIEQEPTDRDYGSREFICRDPEGHVWCFGSYWPKAHEPAG